MKHRASLLEDRIEVDLLAATIRHSLMAFEAQTRVVATSSAARFLLDQSSAKEMRSKENYGEPHGTDNLVKRQRTRLQ